MEFKTWWTIFSFFSNDASISLSMLWVSRRKLYNHARKQIENKYLASVVMYPLTLPKEYIFLKLNRDSCLQFSLFHRNNCHILLIQGVRTNLYHDKGVSRVLRRFWKINFYYDRELIQAYNKNFKNILTVLIFRYKSWWFLCYKRSLIDLTSARICQGCKPCWSQEMKKKLVPSRNGHLCC